MLKDYPKEFKMPSGETAIIRPMEIHDQENLTEFFRQLPKKDRMFLKEDVTDITVINRWFRNLDYKTVIPLIVEIDGKIVADGSLHLDEFGWTRHLGEIRMVVARDFRRKTVALHLVKELYFLAMKLKLEKIIAKMMESQKRAIKIFTELGFKKEAVLKAHVKDLDGKNHNLVIMSHLVTTHWDELESMIQDNYGDFSGDFSGQG